MSIKLVQDEDGRLEDVARVVVDDLHPFDLFLPFVDVSGFREQPELMERPFFSLSKGKRVEPIDYVSPDKTVRVFVTGSDYGIATIWDADILIYLSSVVTAMKNSGRNEIPRAIDVTVYDLLRSIGRPTGGSAYKRLESTLDRLVSTVIKTNVRTEGSRETTFSWLDSWSKTVDKEDRVIGLRLEMSNWFYQSLMPANSVLTIDRRYFELTGGLERWMYRVARKHAGGHGKRGFSMRFKTLYEKAGVQDRYTKFKTRLLAIIEANALPGIDLKIEGNSKLPDPMLHMTVVKPVKPKSEGQGTDGEIPRVGFEKANDPKVVRHPSASQIVEPMADPSGPEQFADAGQVFRLLGRAATKLSKKAEYGELTAETRVHCNKHYPGWDLDQLKLDFDVWLAADPTRPPDDYQRAFIGFVRRKHEKDKFSLPNY